MTFDPKQPFNDLPMLPPTVDVETKEVLKKASEARGALGELKGMTRLIPNPSILLNTLVLEEARDSSEIESIVTTRDSLYEAVASKMKPSDPAVKEVLRYREALWSGYGVVEKRKIITTNLIIDIQQHLISNNAGIRKLTGTALVNDRTGETLYTPPVGEDLVRDLLADLERYINTPNQIDPLVKLAVAHYQFEAIHPFYDGNGRTGRIVNVLYLVAAGLLDVPILYMSKAIIKQKGEYYRLLREVTNSNAWEPWVVYMLSAISDTATATVDLVSKIRTTLDDTAEKVKKDLPKIYTRELVELLFEQPYCKIGFLVDKGIVARQAAGRYLNELEKIGVLQSKKAGKETLYVNSKLYELLSHK